MLSRFYKIILKYKFKYIVRLTGDNPVVDCVLLKEFIDDFILKNLDYSCSNNLPRL